MGHAPPTGRDRPHARHGTGQQGGVQTGKAHAPGRFPVPKSLDGYDFANVRLPDGYTKEQLTGLDFAAKAQDLVFYGKTGRGKTHLATALGMLAIEQGRSVRFRQTAELVLQLGKAKRDGALDSLLRTSPVPT